MKLSFVKDEILKLMILMVNGGKQDEQMVRIGICPSNYVKLLDT